MFLMLVTRFTRDIGTIKVMNTKPRLTFVNHWTIYQDWTSMEKNTQVTKRKSSSVEQFSSKPFFARIDSQIMQRHFFTACSVSFSSSSILVCSSIARCEKRVSVRYLFFFLPPQCCLFSRAAALNYWTSVFSLDK